MESFVIWSFLGETPAQQEGLELLSASSDFVFAGCPLASVLFHLPNFPFIESKREAW